MNSKVVAQTDYFEDFTLNKTLKQTEHWKTSGSVNWKTLNLSEGWNRLGLTYSARRPLDEYWSFGGGLTAHYKFDEAIENFFEARPSMNIQLINKFGERITFAQRFQTEWRFFFYSSGNEIQENYNRNRYRLDGVYLLEQNEENSTKWDLEGSLEWYFLKEPATGERFSNSSEYLVRAKRGMQNGNAYSVSFSWERYNALNTDKKSNGGTIGISYYLQ